MRGKVPAPELVQAPLRITPAHAGKSSNCREKSHVPRDHPRACGEKFSSTWSRGPTSGSPPRMRGKALVAAVGVGEKGITPACAGKSMYAPSILRAKWDHPRVCGEKFSSPRSLARLRGSPPRVRGKVLVPYYHDFRPLDHPRVCGEKASGACSRCRRLGSPPRVRGKVVP